MNSAVLLLEEAAKKHGGKIALIDGDKVTSYLELRGKARKIGSALLALCPKTSGTFSPIPVFMKRGEDAAVAILGVLYSGNPYVPIELNTPPAMLEKIMNSISPSFVIADEEGKQKLEALEPVNSRILLFSSIVNTHPNDNAIDNAVNLVQDSEPICVMHTSGSTGVPKGVVLAHRGVIDYACWLKNTFCLDSETIMGCQSPFSFDSVILEMYSALCASATLIFMPEVLFQYPKKLLEYINENGITAMFFLPTVISSIANSGALHGAEMPYLKLILFGGEVMPTKQLNVWRRHLPGIQYANLYGPTEITVSCTYYIIDRDIDDSDTLPIGEARENMGVLILTEENQTAEIGEVGELCVLGSSLALGYWADAEATRAAFVQNPFNPHYCETMYRTGDLAFWGEDGLIRFVGRKDSQIKLRGKRIELEEIEAAIISISDIEAACVVFDPDSEEIVAFVQTGVPLTVRKLRQQLLDKIPRHMFPSQLKVLDSLPLTPNGKVNRTLLREMVGGR